MRSKLSRRKLLITGGAAALFVHSGTARAIMPERKVFLANPHTGEVFHDIYWVNGRYIPEALRRLDVLCRDHTNDKIIRIAPNLIDVLARLRAQLGITQPIQIVSGYRSPETNAAARRHNNHVARNSYHMFGMAADIRIPGFNLTKLRRAAIAMRAGGVGSYPGAHFIHVDVGPVRVW